MDARAAEGALGGNEHSEDWTQGLSAAEALRRLKQDGPNRLRTARSRSVLSILVAQFKSLIVLILLAAAAFSLVLGDHIEAGAVAAVLVLNAVIGFVSELRGVRSMQALRRLTTTEARVMRDGQRVQVPAEDVVVGDTVLLAHGDMVPADLRLVAANALQCDESALTGESVPVDKDTAPVPVGTPLAERTDCAFKGTAVTRGTATGVVSAIGMGTELGAIAALAETARPQSSPLLRQLDRLGGQLIGLTVGLTALLAGLGTWAGYPPVEMVKVAVALAVAAVPEGLPVVATLVLARGMWRMAAQNAVVKTLSAVETLGATTIILTDKTGTLTENRMALAELALADGDHRLATVTQPTSPLVASALAIAALGSDGDEDGRGVDPIDAALIQAATRHARPRGDLLETHPAVRALPFSHETRMTASVHRDGDGFLFSLKGAPEAVVDAATHVRTATGQEALDAGGRGRWLARNDAMAGRGLRVVALAVKHSVTPDADPYSGLILLGLAGLADPARDGVRAAILAARDAGVRVVMVTGDHRETARAIGQDVALLDAGAQVLDATDLEAFDLERPETAPRLFAAAAFSRVDPRTKLQLAGLYQRRGEIVAMTGDGVNDAPALRKADIGIAMGQRGTDVAREAADIVLRDDSLAAIVAAMRMGRITFANIRVFVTYLLACNLSEIAVIGVAIVAQLPLPLLPLQILFLNLVTDVFPAFALGLGEGEDDVMRRPPRDPKEPILARRHWSAIGAHAALMTIATLGAFQLARSFGLSERETVTVAFATLAFAQLFHVFNMHSHRVTSHHNPVLRNPYIWGALALCAGLTVAAVSWPLAGAVLGTVPLEARAWALVLLAGMAPLAVSRLVLRVRQSIFGRRRG